MESKHCLKISNQDFPNESALKEYIKWDALSLINFIDCRFEEIDLLGIIINFCNFQNSRFNNSSFRKCKFAKSKLENCRIVNMDLTRGEFRSCKFINCTFINCNLSSSDFWECEFVETKFKNSNLDFIIVQDVKFWKSNKCTEIRKSSNFGNLLKDMGLITYDD